MVVVLNFGAYPPSEMAVERIAAGAPAATGCTTRLPPRPALGLEIDESALGAPLLADA